MRKFKNVQKEIIEKQVKSIQCNFCGKTYKFKNELDYSDMTEFVIKPQYGSKKDGDIISFDFCDGCIDKLIDNSKVKPKIKCIF
jgi:hypothetical protein